MDFTDLEKLMALHGKGMYQVYKIQKSNCIVHLILKFVFSGAIYF